LEENNSLKEKIKELEDLQSIKREREPPQQRQAYLAKRKNEGDCISFTRLIIGAVVPLMLWLWVEELFRVTDQVMQT
jgi:hypothetical protein